MTRWFSVLLRISQECLAALDDVSGGVEAIRHVESVFQWFLGDVFFIYLCHSQQVSTPLYSEYRLLRAAVRLRMNRGPIPLTVVPGFEPGTASMASKRVTTELTGPLVIHYMRHCTRDAETWHWNTTSVLDATV